MKNLAFIFVFVSSSLLGQRAIVITSLPANTPSEDQIYLAGDPNSWDPGDDSWIFDEFGSDLILTISEAAPNVFSGKITRGSWQTVEGNASGGFLPNRSFDFSTTDTLYIEVLTWEGEFVPSDLPENLVVFDESFVMTELDRERRIRVLLPSDYNETDIDYPVLYMHDGQNLFSDQESFAGEWEIDESMAMFESEGYDGAIIIAIDNGGSFRIDEYTPYAHPMYGGGEGDLYADFLVNTLKPAIDEEYRTLPDRLHTGVMGSSLGGLISFYAGIKYQDVFSKVGVFSPSFWFNDSIYTFADEVGKDENMQFYFLAGGQESSGLEGDVLSMIDLLEAEGFGTEEMVFEFVPNGQHSEWFWAQEFPDAFEWLYLSSTLESDNSIPHELKVFPNPSSDYINIPISGNYRVTLFDALGVMRMQRNVSSRILNIDHLSPGVYLIRTEKDGVISHSRIVKK